MFRILDQSRTVRLLKPSQISNKVSSRNAVAIDREGFDIRAGDEMEEVSTVRLPLYLQLFELLTDTSFIAVAEPARGTSQGSSATRLPFPLRLPPQP